MAMRVRLDSLEIRNYLGAGDELVTLEFNGKHAVLCGPNGSGKTTVLSALGHVRLINWLSVLQSYSIGRGPSEVSVWEWVDGRPHVTAQLFHSGSQTFRVSAAFILPTDIEARRRIQPLLDPVTELAAEKATDPSQDSLRMSFTMAARADEKAQLESITMKGRNFSGSQKQRPSFPCCRHNTTTRVAGTHRYKMSHDDARMAFPRAIRLEDGRADF